MNVTLFSVLTLGLILVIRHAMEPDHVIAISTIIFDAKSLGKHQSLLFFEE